jgi:hypothetical protein
MSVLDEVLTANAAYAESFGARSELALPPARGFAILTCMDARLDPAKYAGLAEGSRRGRRQSRAQPNGPRPARAQPASAADTTSRASAWMRARCSAPRNDSA